MKRRIRRRHSTINRALQQNFLNLLARHPIVQRRPHMQPKLFTPIQRHHQRHRNHAPRRPIQPRSRPNLSPRIPRDQFLKFLIKRIPIPERPIHMRIAKHLAPHLQPVLVSLLLVHRTLRHPAISCRGAAPLRPSLPGRNLRAQPGFSCRSVATPKTPPPPPSISPAPQYSTNATHSTPQI
jgi:hypothetical protein